MLKIFKRRKERLQKEEWLRLVRLAEENGIYIPPASRKIYDRKPGGVVGMNYWTISLERRAEIAERELKKRGLI